MDSWGFLRDSWGIVDVGNYVVDGPRRLPVIKRSTTEKKRIFNNFLLNFSSSHRVGGIQFIDNKGVNSSMDCVIATLLALVHFQSTFRALSDQI